MADDPSKPKSQQDEETATAILRRKKSPNRLVVDEATTDDASVSTINPATMETLNLFRGDTIIVKGKKRKDTGAFHLPLLRHVAPPPPLFFFPLPGILGWDGPSSYVFLPASPYNHVG
jgi:hypothetical protein